MRIISVRRRGLRRLLETDDARGVPTELQKRIRNILAALISARDIEGLNGPPGWRIHQLTGDRKGIWSISASGNWRITFEVADEGIVDLNLEDHH